MNQVQIGGRSVSRVVLGANPFSGYSHQTPELSEAMKSYFADDQKIWDLLAEAESLGVNTLAARGDDHIVGVLEKYWAQGGTIQWFCQVSCDWGDPNAWRYWIPRIGELGGHVAGMYIHGGVVDHWYANDTRDLFYEALEMIRGYGVAAGFAGHMAAAHGWIAEQADLQPDFQMCSWYNPSDRTKNYAHQSEGEVWLDEHRNAMFDVIAAAPCPVIHYKVFAAANRPIDEAFGFMSQAVRPQDVVIMGIYPKDHPDMLKENIAAFETHVENR